MHSKRHIESDPHDRLHESKNSEINRIRLRDLCRLSVQHWWQMKTNISGELNTIVRLHSLIFYIHINRRPTLPLHPAVNGPFRLRDLGEIVYFWHQLDSIYTFSVNRLKAAPSPVIYILASERLWFYLLEHLSFLNMDYKCLKVDWS